MLLGIHCSVGGGLENAFEEAKIHGVNTMQIFTRNQRQWNSKPISEEEQIKFKNAFKSSNVKVVFSHSSYLINLGSPTEDLWSKSVSAIADEVQRCHDLGLAFTVLHPGASKDTDEPTAIKSVATALKEALFRTKGSQVKILLENTAGQGTALGYKFEHLKEMIELTSSDRIGVCFDTCHAFAAGYDIRTNSGFEKTIKEFDNIIGIDLLCAIHLNDSKNDIATRKDRHEHIGKGFIGVTAFEAIMKSFPQVPKVIETPKEDNMDEVNLKVLRTFVK